MLWIKIFLFYIGAIWVITPLIAILASINKQIFNNQEERKKIKKLYCIMAFSGFAIICVATVLCFIA